MTVRVGPLDDRSDASESDGDPGFYVAEDGPGVPPDEREDGPGVPPDEREDVFETGDTRSQDGTGVGLAVVRELARAHSWTVVVVESDAGGARFEIRGVERVCD